MPCDHSNKCGFWSSLLLVDSGNTGLENKNLYTHPHQSVLHVEQDSEETQSSGPNPVQERKLLQSRSTCSIPPRGALDEGAWRRGEDMRRLIPPLGCTALSCPLSASPQPLFSPTPPTICFVLSFGRSRPPSDVSVNTERARRL